MEIIKTLGKSNESTVLIIPSDLCAYLDLKPGDLIVIKDDVGKHGKFIAIWKKE